MSEKKKAQTAEAEQEQSQAEVSQEQGEAVPEQPDLNQELERLAAENKELQDKLLRQMAEFDNFRKRTAKEKGELYDDATVKCVSRIVAVIDNFERALATPCEGNEEFKKGVQMIFDQLMQTLSDMGVEEIDALGKPFDPELHNAVSRAEDENFEENTVCQVFQKGFQLKGKVIRHAMVVVANS
ncbi:MAG: nucleotide exchange factor GrpE [Oscillospiraceae bacterium]|nr:nucleotide exchange factor GrpE [Oscillospiraceae bacterium]